jgi:hypothetical protein
MLFVSFRRARRFTAPRRMREFRSVFHSPRVIREAAIARVAGQLGQLEEVLIPGASSAGPKLLLLDQSSDPGRRAIAKVLGSLGDLYHNVEVDEDISKLSSPCSDRHDQARGHSLNEVTGCLFDSHDDGAGHLKLNATRSTFAIAAPSMFARLASAAAVTNCAQLVANDRGGRG